MYESLGRAIRERRTRSGLSQVALANATALSRTTVTNIEAGQQGVLVHQLVAIADALGASAGELLDGIARSPELKPVRDDRLRELLGRLDRTTPRTT